MTFDPGSREREAQAEIAATRIAPGVARALVAAPLALVLLWALLEGTAAVRGRSAVARPLAPAGRAAELESRFDERSALVRALRPRLQSATTALAGYGNERALVGRDGWLWFRDDLEHLTGRRPAARFAGDPRRTIAGFAADLRARGVVLLVVPVPLKPTIHPERFATGAARPLRRTGEEALLAELARGGVAVLDLAPALARAARLAPLYLAADTHWTPEAVEIAAREIALRLRAEADLPAGDAALWSEREETATVRGDIVALLDLPASWRPFPAQRVAVRPVAGPARAAAAPVLLLGDSFAGIYSTAELGGGTGAGLPDRLAFALGLPVDRILRNAGGARATREALARELAADPARLDGVRAVVWQFAARELSQGDWATLPFD